MNSCRGATIVPDMDCDKNRFRLTIAYDGRPFEGWQSQPGGNTIQDHIEKVTQKICETVSTVHGSGRTDAGVSAEGQVAHFDAPSEWKMTASDWMNALNAQLPPTIRIIQSDSVAPDFHARFNATGKIYRYRIFTGEVLPPLEYGLTWHRRKLDRDAFLEAIGIFEGTHHFRAFSANRHDGRDQTRDSERTIFQIAALPNDLPDHFVIEIHGNGFLYKMVRFLVGTAAYLATGKIDPDKVTALLASPNPPEKAPYCAPVDGLSLREVCYH